MAALPRRHHLPGLDEGCRHHALSVRGEPRIRQGIPREGDGPLRLGQTGRGPLPTRAADARGSRRSTSPALRSARTRLSSASAFFFSGIALSLGLVELETQIGLVQDRQHLPLLYGVTDAV